VGWTRPAIGKTGTSQNNGSATFVGGTPQMAGAAMVFRPEGGNGGLCFRPPAGASTCSTGNMFGGKTPAQTFFGAMSKILDGQAPLPLPGPDPQYMGGAAR
jgi:membrane peptidoglycan carboxypeptidase